MCFAVVLPGMSASALNRQLILIIIIIDCEKVKAKRHHCTGSVNVLLLSSILESLYYPTKNKYISQIIAGYYSVTIVDTAFQKYNLEGS